MDKKSGKHWVAWANLNAKNSKDLATLDTAFKTKVEAFIKALKDAGVTVTIRATKRSLKRAYLFHWSWKISLGKCNPCDPPAMAGVDIQWDHHIDDDSLKCAKEMVKGFGLAIPPKSTVAPSLTTNHATGLAIDMDIVWKDKVKVKKKDGKEVEITYMVNPNLNTKLIAVAESYGVYKLKNDEPHWSANGR